MQFGWATDTYDADGAALGEATPRDISDIDLTAALAQLSGDIEQMPPAYSAKKIDGRRAYDIARSGETPALKVKNVSVYEFTITGVNESVATFRVRCSAGTYIRSLAHDLGALIGVPAHLKSLRRTAIGNFRVENAIGFQKMSESSVAEILSPPHFVPMGEIELPLDGVVIDPLQEKKILQGQTIVVKPQVTTIKLNDLVSVTNLQQELVGIGLAVEILREEGGPIAIQPKVVLKQ
jgi:tRNA pseudouridine55 synthase